VKGFMFSIRWLRSILDSICRSFLGLKNGLDIAYHMPEGRLYEMLTKICISRSTKNERCLICFVS